MKLKYVRIYEFSLVPDRFFDAKGADYDMDFIRGVGNFLPRDCPNHVLYGLFDDNYANRGILWVSYNEITNSIRVNIFSVDREFQDKNNVKTALEFIKINHKIEGITKLEMATTRVKAFEKYGFVNTKIANMEIELWAKAADQAPSKSRHLQEVKEAL